MQHDFWIVYPIDRVDIRGRDEIVVGYLRGDYGHAITVQRIRGVWTILRVRVVG